MKKETSNYQKSLRYGDDGSRWYYKVTVAPLDADIRFGEVHYCLTFFAVRKQFAISPYKDNFPYTFKSRTKKLQYFIERFPYSDCNIPLKHFDC